MIVSIFEIFAKVGIIFQTQMKGEGQNNPVTSYHDINIISDADIQNLSYYDTGYRLTNQIAQVNHRVLLPKRMRNTCPLQDQITSSKQKHQNE